VDVIGSVGVIDAVDVAALVIGGDAVVVDDQFPERRSACLPRSASARWMLGACF
jgi:hypothetical protein